MKNETPRVNPKLTARRVGQIGALIGLFAFSSGCATGKNQTGAVAQIGQVLDSWHQAAAKADQRGYLDPLTADAVFLGTDAKERWTKEQFKKFVAPYFSKGRGWTYVSRDRHVALAPDGKVAWFDERLLNDKYGELRGTGVLRSIDGQWKIVQYNMVFTIPNESTKDVVEHIKASAANTR